MTPDSETPTTERPTGAAVSLEADTVIEAAAGFAHRLREAGPAADEARQPDPHLMKDLARAGLLRVVVPERYGGHGLEPADFLRFCETLARAHPSTAWAAMTCNEEAGIASAYLEPDSMRLLFGEEPDVVIAGSGVPKGRAVRRDGGWSISGRWDFVSGSTAADRFVLAAVVADDDGEPVRPIRICMLLVDAAVAEIDDTWHTAGLRGTASNDVVLDGLLVADRWCGVNDNHALPRPPDPFYRLPSGLRFPFPKVGIATGTAFAALDEFAALAAGKRPLFSRSNLAERPGTQLAYGRAVARVEAGRAWVLDLAEELMDTVRTVGEIPAELHARCRLAASSAVADCIEAVGLVVAESGSSANRSESPLARLHIDLQAIAGHFMVAGYQIPTAGRVLLGLDSADPQF